MTDASGLRVRPALPAEAAALTALCLRSKAHWGYDAAFIRQSVAALTITPVMIAGGRVLAAEDMRGNLLGVAAVGERQADGKCDLALLFVEPGAIGGGIGRRLFTAAAQLVADEGAVGLSILSDPFAEAFYRRMGAVRVGDGPSDAIRGRQLPLLEFTVVVGGDRQAS